MTSAIGTVRKLAARRERRRSLTPWLFLAPALTLYLALGVWPIARTAYLSLTDTVGTRETGDFVGFDNYRRLVDDDVFIESFKHTVIWIFFNLTVPTTLALFLAVMLNKAIGAKFFRTMFFIPLAISSPAIGVIWGWIYQPNVGLLDQGLSGIGLGSLKQAWLGPDWGLWSLMVAGAWRETAFFMVIFLAGLTSIPPELIEAAQMDGATQRQIFWRVTLPMLRPASMIVISSAIISALLSTDLVLTMTKGGPFGTTDVIGHRMYVETFFNAKFGYGASMGVLIAVVAAIIVIPYLWRMAKLQEED